MKKILTVLFLVLALVCSGINADAQKKKSSSSKTSSSVVVKKNAYGYPDPTGHTYKATVNNVTMNFNFYPDDELEVVAKVNGEIGSIDGVWYQDGNIIYVQTPVTSDSYFVISSDGKVLTDEDGVKARITK